MPEKVDDEQIARDLHRQLNARPQRERRSRNVTALEKRAPPRYEDDDNDTGGTTDRTDDPFTHSGTTGSAQKELARHSRLSSKTTASAASRGQADPSAFEGTETTSKPTSSFSHDGRIKREAGGEATTATLHVPSTAKRGPAIVAKLEPVPFGSTASRSQTLGNVYTPRAGRDSSVSKQKRKKSASPMDAAGRPSKQPARDQSMHLARKGSGTATIPAFAKPVPVRPVQPLAKLTPAPLQTHHSFPSRPQAKSARQGKAVEEKPAAPSPPPKRLEGRRTTEASMTTGGGVPCSALHVNGACAVEKACGGAQLRHISPSGCAPSPGVAEGAREGRARQGSLGAKDNGVAPRAAGGGSARGGPPAAGRAQPRDDAGWPFKPAALAGPCGRERGRRGALPEAGMACGSKTPEFRGLVGGAGRAASGAEGWRAEAGCTEGGAQALLEQEQQQQEGQAASEAPSRGAAAATESDAEDPRVSRCTSLFVKAYPRIGEWPSEHIKVFLASRHYGLWLRRDAVRQGRAALLAALWRGYAPRAAHLPATLSPHAVDFLFVVRDAPAAAPRDTPAAARNGKRAGAGGAGAVSTHTFGALPRLAGRGGAGEGAAADDAAAVSASQSGKGLSWLEACERVQVILVMRCEA